MGSQSQSFLAPGQRYAPAGGPAWRADRQLTILQVGCDLHGRMRVAYSCPDGHRVVEPASSRRPSPASSCRSSVPAGSTGPPDRQWRPAPGVPTARRPPPAAARGADALRPDPPSAMLPASTRWSGGARWRICPAGRAGRSRSYSPTSPRAPGCGRTTPPRCPHAYARHDALLRGAVAGEAGVVYKVVGDGFRAVFPTAAQAVAAAVAAQRALLDEDWSALGLPSRSVRLALHTVAAVPALEGDSRTPGLNRLGRLLATAAGGQVLISGVTAELAHDHLPPGGALRDLGPHRLKDLYRPEHVYELVILNRRAALAPPSRLGQRGRGRERRGAFPVVLGAGAVGLVLVVALAWLLGGGGRDREPASPTPPPPAEALALLTQAAAASSVPAWLTRESSGPIARVTLDGLPPAPAWLGFGELAYFGTTREFSGWSAPAQALPVPWSSWRRGRTVLILGTLQPHAPLARRGGYRYARRPGAHAGLDRAARARAVRRVVAGRRRRGPRRRPLRVPHRPVPERHGLDRRRVPRVAASAGADRPWVRLAELRGGAGLAGGTSPRCHRPTRPRTRPRRPSGSGRGPSSARISYSSGGFTAEHAARLLLGRGAAEFVEQISLIDPSFNELLADGATPAWSTLPGYDPVMAISPPPLPPSHPS